MRLKNEPTTTAAQYGLTVCDVDESSDIDAAAQDGLTLCDINKGTDIDAVAPRGLTVCDVDKGTDIGTTVPRGLTVCDVDKGTDIDTAAPRGLTVDTSAWCGFTVCDADISNGIDTAVAGHGITGLPVGVTDGRNVLDRAAAECDITGDIVHDADGQNVVDTPATRGLTACDFIWWKVFVTFTVCKLTAASIVYRPDGFSTATLDTAVENAVDVELTVDFTALSLDSVTLPELTAVIGELVLGTDDFVAAALDTENELVQDVDGLATNALDRAGELVHGADDLAAATLVTVGELVHGANNFAEAALDTASELVHGVAAAAVGTAGELAHGANNFAAAAMVTAGELVHCADDLTAAALDTAGELVHGMAAATLDTAGELAYGANNFADAALEIAGELVHGVAAAAVGTAGELAHGVAAAALGTAGKVVLVTGILLDTKEMDDNGDCNDLLTDVPVPVDGMSNPLWVGVDADVAEHPDTVWCCRDNTLGTRHNDLAAVCKERQHGTDDAPSASLNTAGQETDDGELNREFNMPLLESDICKVLKTDSADDAKWRSKISTCGLATIVFGWSAVNTPATRGAGDTWDWLKDICDTPVSDALNNADEFTADVTVL